MFQELLILVLFTIIIFLLYKLNILRRKNDDEKIAFLNQEVKLLERELDFTENQVELLNEEVMRLHTRQIERCEEIREQFQAKIQELYEKLQTTQKPFTEEDDKVSENIPMFHCDICTENKHLRRVFQCGHPVCIDCFKHLEGSENDDKIKKCPFCNKIQVFNPIYAKKGVEQESEQESESVCE